MKSSIPTSIKPVAYNVSLVQSRGMFHVTDLPAAALSRAATRLLAVFAATLLVSGLALSARAADESIDGEGGGRRVEKKVVAGAIAEPIVPSGENAAGVKPGDKITKANAERV